MTGYEAFDWSQGDPDYDRVFAEEEATGDASELVLLALERRGMSQSDLAQLLGVTRSAISQRLDGRSNVSIRKLASMLDVLGYGIDFQLVDHRASDELISVRDRARENSYDGMLHPQFRPEPWDFAADSPEKKQAYGW